MKNIVKNTHKGLGKTLNLKPALLKLILVGGVVLTSGCASVVGIGESEYKCPATDGVHCKPTREIYEMTHDGNVPEPTVSEKKSIFGKNKKARKTSDETLTEGKEGGAETKQSKDTVIDNYVAPRLPDRPVPIRTPAHVMRIWIAPWEDTNGDLNTTGYMYTEIEARRWVIGAGESKADPVLRPLQQIQPTQATP